MSSGSEKSFIKIGQTTQYSIFVVLLVSELKPEALFRETPFFSCSHAEANRLKKPNSRDCILDPRMLWVKYLFPVGLCRYIQGRHSRRRMERSTFQENRSRGSATSYNSSIQLCIASKGVTALETVLGFSVQVFPQYVFNMYAHPEKVELAVPICVYNGEHFTGFNTLFNLIRQSIYTVMERPFS